MKWRWVILLATVALGAWGCAPPAPRPDVSHPDVSVKIPSMVTAVRYERWEDIPQLVQDLESDDPAVRFFAIEALYRLTGRRLGYEYFLDEEARRPAVERWRQWLEDEGIADKRAAQ